MPVTIGRYDYTLDPKNRLVIPPRYREMLHAEKASYFILAIGFDGCLWLFLPSQWESLLHDAKSHLKDLSNKTQARAFRRHIYSSALEAPLDEQGRILIPQNLKDYARLKHDVTIAGAGNKAEIWDRARWNSYEKKLAVPSFEKSAKDLDL
jgi:MraZ protein